MDAYYLNKIAEYVTVVSQLDTNALVDEYYDNTISCLRAEILRSSRSM